jgi:hypothetical protein
VEAAGYRWFPREVARAAARGLFTAADLPLALPAEMLVRVATSVWGHHRLSPRGSQKRTASSRM